MAVGLAAGALGATAALAVAELGPRHGARPYGAHFDQIATYTPAPTVTPDADGWLQLPGGALDYAPAGLPDFDQRQFNWHATRLDGQIWTHDGPLAAAGALWWLDSRFEPGPAPPVVANSFPLVSPYGPWDDHDPGNVRYLGNALAAAVSTNGLGGAWFGTCFENLGPGLNAYLAKVGGYPRYQARGLDRPSLGQLAEAIGSGRPVILLLGFWQELGFSGWRRVGGHYVVAQAVQPVTGRLRVSDPFLDRAAVAPSPDSHNDAARVSHDGYTLSPSLRPGPVLQLEGYVAQSGDPVGLLYNFYNQNRLACADSDVPWAEGEAVEAHVDAALLIEVAPPPTATPTASATPSATPTATASPTPSDTPTATASPPPSLTPRPSVPPAETPTGTAPVSTPDPVGTPATASATPASQPTPDPSNPPASATPIAAASATPRPTATALPSPVPPTLTASPTPSRSPTPSLTPRPSATDTATPSPTPSRTATPSRTPVPTATDTATATDLPTATITPTPTSGPGDVCGAVTEAGTRRPISRARVWLFQSEEPLGLTRTVANGTFCFLSLPQGRYDLRAESPGCSSVQRVVDVGGGLRYIEVVMPCRNARAYLPMVIRRVRLR